MNYRDTVNGLDGFILRVLRVCNAPLSRFAIFLIFFWFGALKAFSVSPANGLVAALLSKTMPFIPFEAFSIWFGVFEMVIGVLFLIRGLERIAIPILIIHMITTAGPLVLLPEFIWTAPFVPTLEGQYIIKNIVVIALAIGIAAHLDPLRGSHGADAKLPAGRRPRRA